MDALNRRQFDLYALTPEEWRRMSPRQQAELIRHQNRRQQLEHSLGPLYFSSDALKTSVERAHQLYTTMTPEQRRRVIHPKHLDDWLDSRRALRIVARDLDLPEPVPAGPEYLQPPSYRLPDTGPVVTRASSIHLTVRLNLESPLQTVIAGVRALITALHGPAARRPHRASSPRRVRGKYDDNNVARMVDWYYRQASGTPLKDLAIEAAGPKARHIAAQQRAIMRQLQWFRREVGFASS